jgi:glucosamine 6-phosphate synthetase-like amidotransferase/phosphosugar isomerase protein
MRFAVLCSDFENSIFVTKKDSPLVVALGENCGIVSSDGAPILDYTNIQYVLSNYQYAQVVDINIMFYDKNLDIINVSPITVNTQENEIVLKITQFYVKRNSRNSNRN